MVGNRLDASTVYSITFASVDAPNVEFTADWGYTAPFRREVHAGWPLNNQPKLPTLASSTSVKGEAVAKFYQKVSDQLAPAKGLVMIGEISDTRRTICNLLVSGAEMLLRLRRDVRRVWASLRKRLREFRRLTRTERKRRARAAISQALNSLSSKYLAFTFGIEPLIGDIESLYTVLVAERVERIYVNAKAYSSNSSTSSNWAGYCQNTVNVSMEILNESRITSKCRGAIDLVKPQGANPLAGTAAQLGFSLREVIPTMWELTPFSFLVDYFVNVSHLISTAMYADTSFVYANQSTKSEATQTYTTGMVKPVTGSSFKVYGWNISPTVVRMRRFSFVREKVSPANASIQVHIPPLGRKWLNMLALSVGKLTSPS